MEVIFAGIALMVVLIIAAAVYGVFLLLNPTRTASDRLREARGDQEVDEPDIDILISSQEGDQNALSRLITPSSAEDRNIMRRKLIQAGFKHPRALEILNFTRIALAIGLPIILIPAASSLDLKYAVAMTLGATLFGYFGPYMMVENNINKRKEALLAAFPDSLDLLVSSVEAGLGIDAAFRRVAVELEQASPLLAKEYQLVNSEISAGVPRVEALRHLEKRTGLDEIRSLVNMLAQAERFGTSVAASLRVHANVTRQKRMARAEERAAKVSPKLTVIMILFLLPVLKLTLMGPALIRVFRLWGAPP
ncbi:MAG: type II secretion system F family protein [Alphaproteobacteria bacterium]|nr:type II secretion system F family protein [Alphaproteobacteria bacterium]MCB9691659.1 type II secretion system F family protein [Alphaproteobacteria bacterium]